jgi:two-component system, OmpR family, KDP operon response regulator KdpE
MTAQILVVDDEPAIRRLVRGAVERAGFGVDEVSTASDALVAANRQGCALVLLDLGLPDRDGMELVPLIKAMDRAIIVLTARDATTEKVTALDLGADDYVVKPFDTEELLARIRTALRHRNVQGAADVMAIGPLSIDTLAHRVTKHGSEVKLTRKEFALLGELARYQGRVVTHRHLLSKIWGDAHLSDTEYLRVAVRSLRLKLEDDPAAPTLICNEPGVGYRLITDTN